MERESYTHRINDIKQFILEIATGNFFYKLEPTDRQDEIETVVALLNMMNQELRSIFHQVDPLNSTTHLVQTVFILDEKFRIIACTPNVFSYLGIGFKSLYKCHFVEILSWDSRKIFLEETGKLKLHDAPDYPKIKFSLEFKIANSMVVSTECSFRSLSVFPEKQRFLISALKTTYRNEELEKILKRSVRTLTETKNSQNRAIRREAYRKLVQKLYLKILENLDRPLPKFKELAKEIGASESKLRKGFKAMYGDTVYNFHREKRLEKAFMLLTTTQQSPKQVSLECGFKSAAHFSRKFTKKFGVNPSDLQ